MGINISHNAHLVYKQSLLHQVKYGPKQLIKRQKKEHKTSNWGPVGEKSDTNRPRSLSGDARVRQDQSPQRDHSATQRQTRRRRPARNRFSATPIRHWRQGLCILPDEYASNRLQYHWYCAQSPQRSTATINRRLSQLLWASNDASRSPL